MHAAIIAKIVTTTAKRTHKMPRLLKIAAVQMDVNPAPASQRLERAGRIASAAAQSGAQLVVLPELFNTGYQYTAQNYACAEPLNGPTIAWMKATAARLDVHLAGSLMLLDGADVYNALLLFSPSGEMWRYDKNYPFAWERAYFKPGRDTTVAHTSLGDIGLMICADTSRAGLWRRYAGKVDLMLVCSSPPDFGRPVYTFADGSQITVDEMGPLMQGMREGVARTFCDYLPAQAAWLGVPAVNTVACGQFISHLPNPQATLAGTAAAAPWLFKLLPQARSLQVSAPMVEGTQVISAAGQALAFRSQAEGEGFALAEVALPEQKSLPGMPQPPASVPAYGLVMIDLIAASCVPNYRAGLRQAHGPAMAPVSPHTRKRLGLGVLSLAVGLVLAKIFWRKRPWKKSW
jgi:hypothetical protein